MLEVHLVKKFPDGSDSLPIAKRLYVYLELVIRHRPIFWYLREKKIVVPTQSNAQYKLIQDLQEAFPSISTQCGSCGSRNSSYFDHLKTIVSIHHIGGEKLRNIRLNNDWRRFEHRPDQKIDQWTIIDDAQALWTLAGFQSSS